MCRKKTIPRGLHQHRISYPCWTWATWNIDFLRFTENILGSILFQNVSTVKFPSLPWIPLSLSLQLALLVMFPAMTLLSIVLFLVVMVMIGCDCCLSGDEYLKPKKRQKGLYTNSRLDDVEDVLEKVASACGDVTGCGSLCGGRNNAANRRPSLWDDDGEWKWGGTKLYLRDNAWHLCF